MYPIVEEMTTKCDVPKSLEVFLNHFVKTEDLENFWAQNFAESMRPRSGPMPFQLGLAIQLENRYSSNFEVARRKVS